MLHLFLCLRMLGPRFKSPSYVLFSNTEICFLGEKTEELKVIPQGEGSGKWGGVWLWVAFFSNCMPLVMLNT